MEVLENRQLTKDIFAIDLGGEFAYDRVQPGQFVNILIGSGKSHPLRRPISICATDQVKKQLTLIYRVVGGGTRWLSELKRGDQVNVLGPLGTGFPLPKEGSNVLIVGGGVGIPPLYELVQVLSTKKCTIDIILGFKNKDELFWVEEFEKFGQVTICTEDGSCGQKGFVTTALKKGNWTTLYSCGPRPMLKALKEHFSDHDLVGYVSLEERMACGVGACAGCTCFTQDRTDTKRVCKDGPVFNWEEVAL